MCGTQSTKSHVSSSSIKLPALTSQRASAKPMKADRKFCYVSDEGDEFQHLIYWKIPEHNPITHSSVMLYNISTI